MSSHLEHARLLLEQSRPHDAESFARKAIAENAENVESYLILSYALDGQGKYNDAIVVAQEAVGIDPDNQYTHYTLGRAFLLGSRYQEAEKSLKQANEIDPENAETWGMLSAIAAQKSNWKEAQKLAETGLQYDSESTLCINNRANALVKLNQADKAHDSLDIALANNPEDPYTHYQKGCSLLETGDHEGAIKHLCETLRLDPSFEEAKDPLVEALKARYIIYALFLRYVFFMARLPKKTQFGIFIGGYFIQRIASNALHASGSSGLAYLITGIWLIAILSTWTASSLFNLALFLHPLGKHALSPKEKKISIAVGSCLLLSVLCIVSAIYFQTPALLYSGLAAAFGVIPYSSLSKLQTYWKIVSVSCFGLVVNILTIASIVSIFAGTSEQSSLFASSAIIPVVLYTWLAGAMSD